MCRTPALLLPQLDLSRLDGHATDHLISWPICAKRRMMSDFSIWPDTALQQSSARKFSPSPANFLIFRSLLSLRSR